MSGFEKYRDVVIRVSGKKVFPKTKKDMRELGEATINTLFGHGPTHLPTRHRSPKEHFIVTHMRCVIDISAALEQMEALEIYIRRFPYTSMGVSKVTYLRYNIEGYLQSLYIICNRIKKHLKRIERLYRNDPRAKTITVGFQSLLKAVDDIFDDVLLARHSHVHESQYVDPDLDRLSSLEVFSQGNHPWTGIFRDLFEIELKKHRRKWRTTISNKNRVAREVLDLIGTVLLKLSFKSNDACKYPGAKK